MKTRQFWYPLPERLIAQHPSPRRGDDKMMVLHRDTCVLEHRTAPDIVSYITDKDLLVVNDTKVFPARLEGMWPDTRGAVEILLVSPAPLDASDDTPSFSAALEATSWNAIVGSGRTCRPGQKAVFGPNAALEATLVRPLGGIGMWRVDFSSSRPLMDLLQEFGRTPVPPYVKREGTAEEEKADRERYQTIYARETGSVAAPTAGLHFTEEIFDALDKKGVQRVAVTLHVGPGTFRPVKCDDIEDHHMDFEAFSVSKETADAVNACKKRGGRVFCVGSTTVRTLESVAASVAQEGGDDVVKPGTGASDIFIYPPYRFRVCDCMLTNFHLPQSTLLMMVSALAGRERILSAYAMAVRAGYKFFSYGDCMLIV